MLAIIPARGGSKGLPRKNIRDLEGKPLISYTIEAACGSEAVTRVVVSTDDEEIAEISRKYGADIPFLREKSLASDHASAVDVYIDVVNRLGSDYEKEPFMVLLPTVPFRTAAHIDEAYRLFHKEKARTLVSVTQAETPISWYLSINEKGFLYSSAYGIKEGNMQNRQNDIISYIPNGAIYILEYVLLRDQRTYYCERTIPYIMSKKASVDIDTLEDFEYAEFLLWKEKQKKDGFYV